MRCAYDPAGVARLQLHYGADDLLVPLATGRDTAYNTPGAQLRVM